MLRVLDLLGAAHQSSRAAIGIVCKQAGMPVSDDKPLEEVHATLLKRLKREVVAADKPEELSGVHTILHELYAAGFSKELIGEAWSVRAELGEESPEAEKVRKEKEAAKKPKNSNE